MKIKELREELAKKEYDDDADVTVSIMLRGNLMETEIEDVKNVLGNLQLDCNL